MTDSLHTGNRTLTGPPAMLNYMPNAQNSDNSSQTPLFKQNIFSNTIDGRSDVDNPAKLNSGNPAKNIFADVGESSHIGFSVKSLTQSPSQLPNSVLHASTPNASSFFSSVSPPNSVDLVNSGNKSAKVSETQFFFDNFILKIVVIKTWFI